MTHFDNTPVTDKTITEKKVFLQIPFKFGGTTPSIGFDDEKPDDKAFGGSRIAEVSYADYEYMSILGVYAKTKIIYYGK